MTIDRTKFRTLALSMFLGPAVGCGGATPAGDHTAPQAPPPEVESAPAPAPVELPGPGDECVDWDPTGECIGWDERPGEAHVGPGDECVDWDPTWECIAWE